MHQKHLFARTCFHKVCLCVSVCVCAVCVHNIRSLARASTRCVCVFLCVSARFYVSQCGLFYLYIDHSFGRTCFHKMSLCVSVYVCIMYIEHVFLLARTFILCVCVCLCVSVSCTYITFVCSHVLSQGVHVCVCVYICVCVSLRVSVPCTNRMFVCSHPLSNGASVFVYVCVCECLCH